ncbi:MAG: hypothetical protein WDN69_20690 [Aliidongia sp.]
MAAPIKLPTFCVVLNNTEKLTRKFRAAFEQLGVAVEQRRTDEKGRTEADQGLAQIELWWTGEIGRMSIDPRTACDDQGGGHDLPGQPLLGQRHHGCGQCQAASQRRRLQTAYEVDRS